MEEAYVHYDDNGKWRAFYRSLSMSRYEEWKRSVSPVSGDWCLLHTEGNLKRVAYAILFTPFIIVFGGAEGQGILYAFLVWLGVLGYWGYKKMQLMDDPVKECYRMNAYAHWMAARGMFNPKIAMEDYEEVRPELKVERLKREEDKRKKEEEKREYYIQQAKDRVFQAKRDVLVKEAVLIEKYKDKSFDTALDLCQKLKSLQISLTEEEKLLRSNRWELEKIEDKINSIEIKITKLNDEDEECLKVLKNERDELKRDWRRQNNITQKNNSKVKTLQTKIDVITKEIEEFNEQVEYWWMIKDQLPLRKFYLN